MFEIIFSIIKFSSSYLLTSISVIFFVFTFGNFVIEKPLKTLSDFSLLNPVLSGKSV